MTATVGTDALLVAAELLANAARHIPGPQRLELDLDIRSLRISVTDPAPAPPRPRPHRPDAVHGHGLFIADTRSADSGRRARGHARW
ncbi:hypothetical protein [Kitasatospora sp. NPDC085464]|uniref:hypothetical protein n=1 Tax=Kitasatospora sp. NPDC085464 TaxID=3364063 RepID=UPI0037CCB597